MNPGGPGWNDPPSLSYEIHSQTATRRNNLTKRVGLPDLKLPESAATAAESSAAPPLKGLLPPPSSGKNEMTKPPIGAPPAADQACENSKGDAQVQPPTKIFNPLDCNAAGTDGEKESETKDSSEDVDVTDVDIVHDLKSITEKCLNLDVITKQVSGTILKKLDILDQQLESAKLPETVKEKMAKLTACLLGKKYDAAWDIHVSLMCDHSSSVIQWMVGVKRLISEAKKLPN